jgi:hypothetical protein
MAGPVSAENRKSLRKESEEELSPKKRPSPKKPGTLEKNQVSI